MRCMYGEAKPLDDEELAELVEEDLVDQLLLLDGVPYDVEDLNLCDGCNLFFVEPLDEYSLCEDCAREATEWEEHIKIESSLLRRAQL